MLTFVTILHILVAILMIFVILLQPGKEAGMGSALGGGAASSAFGGRGAVTVLSKMTAVFATLFFISSLGLSFVGLRTSVVLDDEVPARAAPAAGPGAAAVEGLEQREPAPVPPAPAAPPSEPVRPRAAPSGAADLPPEQ